MNAYVDTSALLRLVMKQPGGLPALADAFAVSSVLIEVEVARALDRLRLTGSLGAGELDAVRRGARSLLDMTMVIELDSRVFRRAAEPMPVVLGTLDAIHLASALLWREESDDAFVFATHDVALATAARLHGFDVIGA